MGRSESFRKNGPCCMSFIFPLRNYVVPLCAPTVPRLLPPKHFTAHSWLSLSVMFLQGFPSQLHLLEARWVSIQCHTGFTKQNSWYFAMNMFFKMHILSKSMKYIYGAYSIYIYIRSVVSNPFPTVTPSYEAVSACLVKGCVSRSYAQFRSKD